MDNTSKNVLLIFLVVLIFYLMSALSTILVPLVLAFLFASLFQPLIMFFKNRKAPGFLILPAVAIITLIVIFGIVQVVMQTIYEIQSQQEYLFARLNYKIEDLLFSLNYFTETYFQTRLDVDLILSKLKFESVFPIAGNLATGLGSFTGSFVMFAIYYIVLLTSLSEYKHFIYYVGGDKDGARLLANFEVIQKAIFSYLTLKTLLNIITGAMTYFICIAFGIKFAFFCAFLTFLFFYLPTIGSILAPIFPVVMGFIEFDTFEPVLFLLLCIAVMQAVMGNIVEPIVMGNRLRLNTLTVIFGIVFWGYIWGIPGMMLCVPLLVIFKLIFEQIPGLEIISRIMSEPSKDIRFKDRIGRVKEKIEKNIEEADKGE